MFHMNINGAAVLKVGPGASISGASTPGPELAAARLEQGGDNSIRRE